MADTSLEERTIKAANAAVDEIVLSTVVAVFTPTTAPEFEPAVMALLITIVQAEGLLAATANVYPHREPECFKMYSDLSVARRAIEKLLRDNGIVPLVIDL